jgi:hypothetical protein
MVREFQPSDEGMAVRTADHEMVGTIESIEGNKAHVKPESGLSESTRKRLNWGDGGKEMYTLRHSKVAKITDDSVELKD